MEIFEEQLVLLMQAGNADAFERCYRLLSAQVFSSVYQICRNREQAEDIVQDTFIDAFNNIKSYSHQGRFQAWIKRIAFYKTINLIKRQAPLVDVDVTTLPLIQGDDHTLTLEQDNLLERLLQTLNENERFVVWLYVVEQYQHDEIAQMVNKSPSYSKSIVSRALAKIRLSKEYRAHAK